MFRRLLPLAISATGIVVFVRHSHAQGASPCNNQTRTLQQVAGYVGLATTTCSQLTITVAGQAYSTPPTCTLGYAYYRGSVYTCGPVSTGTHCNSNGFKVTIDLATGGGCPSLAGLNPGSWTSWSQVPAAIVAALRCVSPSVTQTFDWSASVSPCVPTAPVEGSSDPVSCTGGSGETFLRCTGDPFHLLSGNEWKPLSHAYDVAQTGSPDELPLPLREAHAAYGPIHGADLQARIEMEVWNGAVRESATGYDITGRVLSDGRFDVVCSTGVHKDGIEHILIHRLRQDHSAFFMLPQDGGECVVVDAGYLRRDSVFMAACRPVAALLDWVARPQAIAFFSDAVYTPPQTAENGTRTLSRLVPYAGESAVSETYTLVAGSGHARVVEHRTMDLMGRVRQQTHWSEPMQVTAGVWRARRTTLTDRHEGTEDGRRTVVRSSISRAQILGPGTELPMLGPDPERIWLVWR